MRSIKLVFGLAMAVCLLAVVASSAMAGEWEQCQTEKNGKFETSECKGAGKGWEWKQLFVKEAVESEGTLKLTDKAGGIFGEAVTVECKGFDEGTVGPGTEDEITNITSAKGGTNKTITCTAIAGICPSPVTAEAVNLPWPTQLVQIGSEIRDAIHPHSGGGAPGWKVSCNGTLDECTTTAGGTKIKNAANGQEVEAEFEKKSALADCKRGGKAQGEVSGIVFIRQKNGHALRVK
jgi:hypothetical protein